MTCIDTFVAMEIVVWDTKRIVDSTSMQRNFEYGFNDSSSTMCWVSDESIELCISFLLDVKQMFREEESVDLIQLCIISVKST